MLASEQTEVVIVGAGPTGLTAAVRLAQLGIPYVLLDASSGTDLDLERGPGPRVEPRAAGRTGGRRRAGSGGPPDSSHRHGRPRPAAAPGAVRGSAEQISLRPGRTAEHHRGAAPATAGRAGRIGAPPAPRRNGADTGRRRHRDRHRRVTRRRCSVHDPGAIRHRSRRLAQHRPGRARARLPRPDVPVAVRARRRGAHRAVGTPATRPPSTCPPTASP